MTTDEEIAEAHETAKRIIALAYSGDLKPHQRHEPDMRLEMVQETLKTATALQMGAIAIRLASIVIYQADEILKAGDTINAAARMLRRPSSVDDELRERDV